MATAPDKALPPIIVKRVKKAAHGSHGGVWKIAYADFVTAMMAFFLLMWVLGSTTSGDLAGISAYFQNPLRVAVAGGSGSGDATRIIKGGGDNIFKQAGQEARADSNTPQRKVSNEEQVDEQFRQTQQAKLEQTKRDLEQQIASDPALDKFKSQIFMDITSEGLRIQIVDEKNRPMFASGSAEMAPQTQQLLTTIGRALSGLDNRLRIEGHTDSRRFGGGPAGYGNWELSSERANAARRAIVSGGLQESRIGFVAGFADSVQLNPADPNDPLNRRISLLVLKSSSGGSAKPAAAASAAGAAAAPVAAASAPEPGAAAAAALRAASQVAPGAAPPAPAGAATAVSPAAASADAERTARESAAAGRSAARAAPDAAGARAGCLAQPGPGLHPAEAQLKPGHRPHRGLAAAAAALCWGCALPTAATEHPPKAATPGHAKPPAAAKAGAAAPAPRPESAVQALVRRYDSAQVVVLQQQLCLLRPGCATDEGRLLDALGASKEVLQTLADMSQAGDVEAAYERGMLALRAAKSHTARSQAETDAQFPATASVLRRRWAQEVATAQLHLGRAAAQGHPPACQALAEHLGARQPQPEPALVARLFRCAVVGYHARGDRASAINAYARMRETVGADEPLLIEAHSVIYRHLLPDRPWRQVEPDEALALRRQVAP